MKKTIIGLTTMAFLAVGTTGFSMDNTELHKELQLLIEQNKQLTQRIQKLEKQMALQETTSHEKTASSTAGEDRATSFRIKQLENQVARHSTALKKKHAATATDSFLKTMTDRVELGALVAIETNVTDDDIANEDTSNVSLDTVEIHIDAHLSEWSRGHILLLYEDNDDGNGDLNIDEGTISLGNLESFPLYLNAGKMYLPFGSFESYMIADPLTLEIGETNDSVVQLGFETTSGFYGSVFGFNGDIEETGENDQIDVYGANIGYGMQNSRMAFDVGGDWINNIADSDGIGDHLENRGVADPEKIDDYVDAISVHATFSVGPFSLIGEYLASLDDFEQAEIAWKSGGAEPKAYNIEAAFTTTLFNRQTIFALGYQGTDEAVDLGLVEDLYIGAVRMNIFPHIGLIIEYSLGDDYSTSDGGTGNDINSATMQLAMEF